MWKIDEIQIPRLDPFITDQAYLKFYPDLRWLFISNMYAPYVPVFGYFVRFTMTLFTTCLPFFRKENCIRSHYDRLNSNFDSVPDFFSHLCMFFLFNGFKSMRTSQFSLQVAPTAQIINSHIFYPTCAKSNKHAQGQYEFS